MTNETLTSRPVRWLRALEIAMVAGGAGLLLFHLFQLVWFRFGSDQAHFAVISDGLLQGELPYRDRWTLRPPGIFLFYSVGQLLFGKTMMAVRLVEAGALLSLFVALPIYSRRFVGSAVPGYAGALLATLTHVQLEFWHTGQSESFGGVVLVWAVLLATWRPGTRGRQLVAWTASGALFAFAAMLKPPLGGGFVLCLALIVRAEYRARGEGGRDDVPGQQQGVPGNHLQAARRWLLEPIMTFAAGGALVVAATLLPFIAAGAVSDLVWTYRDVVPGYVAVSAGNKSFTAGLYRAMGQLLFKCSPYFAPGLALWALLPPLGRRERAGVLCLAAVLVPQVIGVALQTKFFDYHYGGMVHLLALWSAWGYYKLWLRVRRRPLWAVPLLVAVVLVHDVVRPDFWHRSGQRWQAVRNREQRVEIQDRLHSFRHHDAGQMRRVAKWLRANTAPDARVLVWGIQSAIYFQSGRRPASRFIANGVFRFSWCAQRADEILRREIETELPEVIVVSRRDAILWASGSRIDSAQLLKETSWLQKLVATRYQRVKRFGKLAIFRLAPKADPPDRPSAQPRPSAVGVDP